MSELQELNSKIKYELNEARSQSVEEDPNNESEGDEAPKKEKGGVFGIRQETARIVAGKAIKDFDWKVDYDVLRKAICEEVVTVDLSKAKKIFKLVKDYMNDKEKFEEKYNK